MKNPDDHKPRHLKSPSVLRLLVVLLLFALSSLAQAANWARLLEEFAGTSKVSKGAAASGDEAMNLLRRGNQTTEAAAREAKHLGINPTSKPLLRQALVKTLRGRGAEPSALRFVDELADAEVDVAVVLLRGGRRLQEAVPDVITRARLTREGGPSVLASLGLRDAAVTEDFLKIDALTAVGSLPAKIGGKAPLARFGELIGDTSERFVTFYARYIRGNEKKWAAGGALVWWLADPDSFQNALGELTEAGFKKAAALGGEALASALRGIAEGGKEAGKQVVTATVEGFLSGPYAWAAWLALLVFFYLAGLALPISRRLFLLPVRALFRVPR